MYSEMSFSGILALQVQQLRHHQVGHLIVDRRPQEDDPLVEQPRIDVELAVAAGRPLYDHRDQWHRFPTLALGARAALRC